MSPRSILIILVAGLTLGPLAAQCETQTVVPSIGGNGDLFAGTLIATSGDLAATSSAYDGTPGNGAGTVFVFQRGPSGWGEIQAIHCPTGATKSLFGTTLALSGDRLLVGSYKHLGKSGPAFVYDRRPSGWELAATLDAPQSSANDVYGRAIALDGSTAVVSRSKDSTVMFEAGSVYVFERKNHGWIRSAQLRASDPEIEGRFGNRIALDGDTMLVGAWWDGPFQTGAVYVFERGPAGWSETIKLRGDAVGKQDWFGVALALEGDVAVVGAAEDYFGPGSAYVFERGAAGWVRTARLRANDGEDWDRFGVAVALQGDRIAVGARRDDDVGTDGGAVYVFERVEGGWAQTAKRTASNGAPGDWLGTNVAWSGDELLAGAPFRDALAADSGALHVFSMPRGARAYCFGGGCPCGNGDSLRGCANSTGRGALLAACGSVGAASDDLVLALSSTPANGLALLAMGGARRNLPYGDGLLCVAPGGTGLFRFPLVATDGAGAATFGPGIVAASQAFGAGAIDAGETWYFQSWFRDARGPCGTGFGLSNAVAVSFAP